MPKDSAHRFTAKEHEQATHIKESYMKRGLSEEEAERRAWATVNASKSKYKVGLGDLRRGGKGRQH